METEVIETENTEIENTETENARIENKEKKCAETEGAVEKAAENGSVQAAAFKSSAHKKADLCLKSKAVYTGLKDHTEPLSVLVSGEKILAVVPYGEEAPFIDSHTQVLDLGEQMIMPGFVDAHTHFFLGAFAGCDRVCDAPVCACSEAACVEMMKEFARKHPGETRLRGRGWFVSAWENKKMPTKESLDAAFPDVPVYMQSIDAHCYWLNSMALKECGITRDSTVKSGYIEKGADGEPDGLLAEIEACIPADRMYHDFPPEEEKEIYLQLLKQLAKWGITSVSEMTSSEYDESHERKYRLLQEIEEEGKLNARVHIYTKLVDCENYHAVQGLREKFQSPRIQFTGLKGFVDGVLEAHTGMLVEPYSDRPDTCGDGMPLFSQEDLNGWITQANKEGLPVRLHCVGDGAVRMALNGFAASKAANGSAYEESRLPNAIEHIEVIHPEDIDRFKELQVIPSLQPMHLVMDKDSEYPIIGRERAKYEWMEKTLLEKTGILAIGTDYPVTSLSPFETIYAAVTRCTLQGEQACINPEQRLTMAQVLRGYTMAGAIVYGREQEIGSLEPGKYADVAVVDRDLFKVQPEEILQRQVMLTMMNGKVIYSAL